MPTGCVKSLLDLLVIKNLGKLRKSLQDARNIAARRGTRHLTCTIPTRPAAEHRNSANGRPSQASPYPSAFMALPAWPMYMPSYLPRPLAQQSTMQAEHEELAMQCHDLKARELEVEQITRA